MKIKIFIALFLIPLSCNLSSQDQSFRLFLQEYRKAYLQQYPMLGSQSGQHQYDYLLPVADETHRAQEKSLYQDYLKELNHFSPSRLSPELRFEYNRLLKELNSGLERVQSNASYWQDPSLYDAGLAIKYALENQEMSIRHKMGNIFKRLQQVPAYYEAAKVNVQEANIQQLHLALRLNRAGFFYLQNDLRDSLQMPILSTAEQSRFLEKLHLAELAIKDYVAYCNSLIFDHYDKPSILNE